MLKSNFGALLKKARDFEAKSVTVAQPDENSKRAGNCSCVSSGECAIKCGKGKRSDSVLMVPSNTYHFFASVVVTSIQLPAKSALKAANSDAPQLTDLVCTGSSANNNSFARNRVTFLLSPQQGDTVTRRGLYGTHVHFIASLLVLTAIILHFRQISNEPNTNNDRREELCLSTTLFVRSFRPWNKYFPTVRASSIVSDMN
jgi:hypothetical protein